MSGAKLGQLCVLRAPVGYHGRSGPAAEWGRHSLSITESVSGKPESVASTAVPVQETCFCGLGLSQDRPLAPDQDWKWRWLPLVGTAFRTAFRLTVPYLLASAKQFAVLPPIAYESNKEIPEIVPTPPASPWGITFFLFHYPSVAMMLFKFLE